MADIKWYVNRLRAMSPQEILWRLHMKRLEKAERKAFQNQNRSVVEGVFYQGKEDLIFHAEKLGLPAMPGGGQRGARFEKADNRFLEYTIPLLGGYDYAAYRKKWHAGFQTEKEWPLEFSYDLSYKQRDDIGDARTNWELNRHFQFALLAHRYALTGQTAYLQELQELFCDWIQKNPFLTGISWTSVMEVAIRDINWIYTLGFLMQAEAAMQKDAEEALPPDNGLTGLCQALRHGVINMTCYVAGHYSRFSSANNHVIVEAAAIGLAGIAMDCEEWQELAFYILKEEIPRQNYRDGVNREVSLHYQSFFMEAVGLLALAMEKNGRRLPMRWRDVLTRMSRYLADCQGDYGETVVFGDDDEGKILDFSGKGRNHYGYVLQLMSLVLPERFAEEVTDESLCCLVSEEERQKLATKPLYQKSLCACYEEGGVSLVRSRDGRMLLGIDHGELGFGSIAAHGHADALSFQLYLEGRPVFADAGTCIYHCDLPARNAFRKTENHNTLTVNAKDQSEMLGAFLWGRRAECRLLEHNLPVAMAEGEKKKNGMPSDACILEAMHDGYAPVLHRRRFTFMESTLVLCDKLEHIQEESAWQWQLVLGPEVAVCADESMPGGPNRLAVWQLCCGSYEITVEVYQKAGLCAEGERKEEITDISFHYGIRQKTKKLIVRGKSGQDVELETIITWRRGTLSEKEGEE